MIDKIIEVAIESGPMGIAFVMLLYVVVKGLLVPKAAIEGMIGKDDAKVIAAEVAEVVLKHENERRQEEYKQALETLGSGMEHLSGEIAKSWGGYVTLTVEQIGELLATYQAEIQQSARSHQKWSEGEFDRLAMTMRGQQLGTKPIRERE